MKRVEIEFDKGGIIKVINVVQLNFSYIGIKGKSGSSVYTNLVQVFFPVHETDLLPEFVNSRIMRKYSCEGRVLGEIEDITYNLKYELNNGTIMEAGYISSWVRIQEVVRNLQKPEMVNNILKILSDAGKTVR